MRLIAACRGFLRDKMRRSLVHLFVGMTEQRADFGVAAFWPKRYNCVPPEGPVNGNPLVLRSDSVLEPACHFVHRIVHPPRGQFRWQWLG